MLLRGLRRLEAVKALGMAVVKMELQLMMDTTAVQVCAFASLSLWLSVLHFSVCPAR